MAKVKMSLKDRISGPKAKANFQKMGKVARPLLGKVLSIATGGTIDSNIFLKQSNESDEDYNQRLQQGQAAAIGGLSTANPDNSTTKQKFQFLSAKYGKFAVVIIIFGVIVIIFKKFFSRSKSKNKWRR